MFSQSAEYVLRVVVHLASHEGKACTNHQIAQATRVPEGYLAKLLQGLGRAGLVDSQRGLHGGFVLARPASELSVADVVAAVDPIRRVQSCPLGIASHDHKLCALHRRLDAALESIEQAFRQTMISEMLNGPADNKPFCAD